MPVDMKELYESMDESRMDRALETVKEFLAKQTPEDLARHAAKKSLGVPVHPKVGQPVPTKTRESKY